MNWKLLARHIRKCPKCEAPLLRKKKNLWSKDIKHIGTKTLGMECENKDCDFFITMQKLKELAPTKKQQKAKRDYKLLVTDK